MTRRVAVKGPMQRLGVSSYLRSIKHGCCPGLARQPGGRAELSVGKVRSGVLVKPVFPGCTVLAVASEAFDALPVKAVCVGDVVETDRPWLHVAVGAVDEPGGGGRADGRGPGDPLCLCLLCATDRNSGRIASHNPADPRSSARPGAVRPIRAGRGSCSNTSRNGRGWTLRAWMPAPAGCTRRKSPPHGRIRSPPIDRPG